MYFNHHLILILGLITATRCQHNIVRRDMSYFTALFGPPMACRATLKKNYQGVTLQNCTPFADMEGVTEVAEVQEIDLKLVIQTDGRPGIEIFFKAASPTSQQKYKINVVHSIDGKIYCGIISTEKPTKKILHEISLIMTCYPNTLTRTVGVNVAVNPTIDDVQKGNSSQNYTMPYCHDSVMIRTTECAEYRRNRIKFDLQPVSNGVKVTIDMKLAYHGRKSSKVNLQLRIRRPRKGINGFDDVGNTVTLTYPQNTYVFQNLVHGEHYRVLTWRDTDDARYIRDITLGKSVHRERRHSYSLSRTPQR